MGTREDYDEIFMPTLIELRSALDSGETTSKELVEVSPCRALKLVDETLQSNFEPRPM
jgi:hypothetical protein